MRYYQIDLVAVVRGDGPPPRLVIAAARALPDTSLTAALTAGGREHYGWGADRYMQANIYDALNANTRVSGNWGKKQPPKIPEYPRPSTKDANTKTSVAAGYGRFGGARILKRGERG